MSMLVINSQASIVNVDHQVKKWKDKDSGKEQVSDCLLVSLFCNPDFAVLRFRDPSASVLNSFKVGGKLPPLRFLRITLEKGVNFLDCEIEQ